MLNAVQDTLPPAQLLSGLHFSNMQQFILLPSHPRPSYPSLSLPLSNTTGTPAQKEFLFPRRISFSRPDKHSFTRLLRSHPALSRTKTTILRFWTGLHSQKQPPSIFFPLCYSSPALQCFNLLPFWLPQPTSAP